ncbi:MAG: hypothetical protein Q8O67_03405 [Deltaproteobacteria bacterium]|nr:hypothetical protein [Deltaproteobacteria bacterium]
MRSVTFIVVLVSVVGVVGCPAAQDCTPRFSVAGERCASDDDGGCELDFGKLAAGLSDTRRLQWVGACNADSIFGPFDIVGDDDDAFELGQTGQELGEHFDEGFAFVTARPLDDEEHEAMLVVVSQRGDTLFPLVVNRAP